jgi:hypothetical protein
MAFVFYDTDNLPIFTGIVQVGTASPAVWTFFFKCLPNKAFSLITPIPDATVEMREDNEVSWIDLQAGDYDMTPYANSKHTFHFRVTPDNPRVNFKISGVKFVTVPV